MTCNSVSSRCRARSPRPLFYVYTLNRKPGVVLGMSPLPSVPHLALILKDYELIALVLSQDLSYNLRSCNYRLSCSYVIAVSIHEDPLQSQGVTLSYIKKLNIYNLPGRYFI